MITVCTCERAAATVVTGVPVHAMSVDQAVTRLARMVACPASHVVNAIASDPIVRAADLPELRRALWDADLNLADGMSAVWATRLLGATAGTERVYGTDLLLAVAGRTLGRPLRHGFLGGTEPVLEALVGRLSDRFPSMDIVAAYPPPLRGVTADAVAEDVGQLHDRAGAPLDVLWVGLGTPKQQIWAHHARGHDVAKVIVTIGAAFDFISGAKPQAPGWMGPIGLEWLFRLASEPRRLWRRYLIGNPRFVAAVARQWLSVRRARP